MKNIKYSKSLLSQFTAIKTFTLSFLILLLSFPLFAQIQAKKADDFVNSIGLATHLNYNGVYTNVINVKNQLLNLGIKHIRDGLNNKYSSVKLLANNGIKITGVLQGDFGKAAQTPTYWLQQAKKAGAIFAFEAFEGPNEPDLPKMSFQYKGQGWPLGVKAFQIDLYNTVKNDPSVADRPVLGPTIGNGFKKPWATSMGDISAYVDYGNFHYYKGWGQSYSEGFPNWDLQSIKNIHNIMFGTKPYMATEGSYNTAINNGGISEVVDAKYTLRYFLEYWRIGVVRTFKYQLFDEGTSNANSEDKFGLINNDGTTLKPSALALKNLITLLSETNPANIFTPSTLNFTITNADAFTHYNLLQKSDGKFYLIIWNDAQSWNNDTKSEINNDDFVNIVFNQPVLESKQYAPCTNGTDVVSTIVNPTTLSVRIPNHPLIFEINTYVVVPLSLISFTAKSTDKTTRLTWKTENEINLKQFDVERSSDGINYTQISIVSSNGGGIYNAIDNSSLNGNNYYRLRMIDTDGKFKYSETVVVENSLNKSVYTIFPNPVKDVVTISIADNAKKVKFCLIDFKGQRILMKQIVGTTTLSLATLNKGIYLIQLSCEGVINTFKLIKE